MLFQSEARRRRWGTLKNLSNMAKNWPNMKESQPYLICLQIFNPFFGWFHDTCMYPKIEFREPIPPPIPLVYLQIIFICQVFYLKNIFFFCFMTHINEIPAGGKSKKFNWEMPEICATLIDLLQNTTPYLPPTKGGIDFLKLSSRWDFFFQILWKSM